MSNYQRWRKAGKGDELTDAFPRLDDPTSAFYGEGRSLLCRQ
jgi:hypothetical protein